MAILPAHGRHFAATALLLWDAIDPLPLLGFVLVGSALHRPLQMVKAAGRREVCLLWAPGGKLIIKKDQVFVEEAVYRARSKLARIRYPGCYCALVCPRLVVSPEPVIAGMFSATPTVSGPAMAPARHSIHSSESLQFSSGLT